MHYLDILGPLYEAHEDRTIRDWIAKRDDLPKWVIPYELGPVDSGFSYATNLLADAALRADADMLDDGEKLRQAYVETAVAIGERFRAMEWRAAYLGMPLLAAHMVARSIVAGMAEADQLWDHELGTLLRRYIRALWPAVDKANSPAKALHTALALRRRLLACGLGEVRGMEDMVKLGTVENKLYPVAVTHLLRKICRSDMSIDARERRGQVLVDMLAHALP